jgi:hypothetical protein
MDFDKIWFLSTKQKLSDDFNFVGRSICSMKQLVCMTFKSKFYTSRLGNVLITAATRSKARTVFVRYNAGIRGSNPTQGMNVCVRLFCVCFVLCVGSGLGSG